MPVAGIKESRHGGGLFRLVVTEAEFGHDCAKDSRGISFACDLTRPHRKPCTLFLPLVTLGVVSPVSIHAPKNDPPTTGG